VKSDFLNNKQDNKPGAIKGKPTIRVIPESISIPYKIQVYGFGWGLYPVNLYLDQKHLIEPIRFLTGTRYKTAVKPEEGAFLILVNMPDLKSGTHIMSAVAEHKGKKKKQLPNFI